MTRLTDGTTRSHHVPEVRGNAANPIPVADLRAKFEANAAHLGPDRTRRIADMVMSIEHLPSLRPLMAELGHPPA